MAIKKIYSDIDGVIVDMNAGYLSAFGMLPPQNNKKYYGLTKNKKGFWETLPWRADAFEYWKFIKSFCKKNNTELFILTAPPKDNLDPTFYAGRRKWILDNLGPKMLRNTIIEYDKYKYSDPNSMLIDDRVRNTKPWAEAGGMAIVYSDFIQFKKDFEVFARLHVYGFKKF